MYVLIHMDKENRYWSCMSPLNMGHRAHSAEKACVIEITSEGLWFIFYHH